MSFYDKDVIYDSSKTYDGLAFREPISGQPPSIKIFDIKPVSRTMKRDIPIIKITSE